MSQTFSPDAKLKLDFGGEYKFEGSIRQVCRIDPNDLDKEREEHPARLAWFGVLKAKSTFARKDAESTLKTVVSEVDNAAREEYSCIGQKYTEKMIEGVVDINPRVLAARDARALAEYNEEAAEALFVAYRQRKDLIITMANDRASERAISGMAP